MKDLTRIIKHSRLDIYVRVWVELRGAACTGTSRDVLSAER